MSIEALDCESEIEFNTRYLSLAFSDLRMRNLKSRANAGQPVEDDPKHPFIGMRVMTVLTSMFESVESDLVNKQIPPHMAIEYCSNKLKAQLTPKNIDLPEFSESPESLKNFCAYYCDENDIPHNLDKVLVFDGLKVPNYLVSLRFNN